MTDAQLSKVRDMARDGRLTPKDMEAVLCDFLVRQSRLAMQDNLDEMETNGQDAEADELRTAMKADVTGNARLARYVAYEVDAILNGTLGLVQDRLGDVGVDVWKEILDLFSHMSSHTAK